MYLLQWPKQPQKICEIILYTWLHLMWNKKTNLGADHSGPRGLDYVVCWKCLVSQEAVSTTSVSAKRGPSRLLSVGTLLSLTVILMMRRTPLLLFWSLSEQEITCRATWNSFQHLLGTKGKNSFVWESGRSRGRLKTSAQNGRHVHSLQLQFLTA